MGQPHHASCTAAQTDRKVAGVCDGPGRLLQVDVTLVHVLFAGLAVFGGSGLVHYLAMWILVPDASKVRHQRVA
jgi:phage shock protein PspC (stress-responsive transcriptional regulator)